MFELIYSAQLKRQNTSDSQIAVYFHPCNQNTDNHFGPLKQEEIGKLTFVIAFQAFSWKQADPFVFVFYVLFVNFLSYFTVKYVQQLEDISKSSKYCLGYILKGQKVLNDRMKLENNKATPSWKFSPQEGLALVAPLSTSNELPNRQKNKNKQTGLSATYYSAISSSITTFS